MSPQLLRQMGNPEISFKIEISMSTSILISEICKNMYHLSVHEITAVHRSLSGAISRVSDRIRFRPVTMTGRFSNFNSISYTVDWHKLRVTGTKCRLPDTLSVTCEIFNSGTDLSEFRRENTVKPGTSGHSLKRTPA